MFFFFLFSYIFYFLLYFIIIIPRFYALRSVLWLILRISFSPSTSTSSSKSSTSTTSTISSASLLCSSTYTKRRKRITNYMFIKIERLFCGISFSSYSFRAVRNRIEIRISSRSPLVTDSVLGFDEQQNNIFPFAFSTSNYTNRCVFLLNINFKLNQRVYILIYSFLCVPFCFVFFTLLQFYITR